MPGVGAAIFTLEGRGVYVKHPVGYNPMLPVNVFVGGMVQEFMKKSDWVKVKNISKACVIENRSAIFTVRLHIGNKAGFRNIHISPNCEKGLINLWATEVKPVAVEDLCFKQAM